jgi:hypothetical protein
MPRKGGGGQNPPDDEGGTMQAAGEEPISGAMDRSTEYEEDEQDFVYGDIVQDEGTKDPEDLVVVNLPNTPADRWEVDGGTLADQHPMCPPQDDVIIVVPLVELDEYMPGWDNREEEIPLKQLEEDGVTTFVYPNGRLDLVEPSHLRDD